MPVKLTRQPNAQKMRIGRYERYASKDSMKLRDLKGLGPKSEKCLIEIGINTPDDLRRAGPVRAFIRLKKESNTKPSLNLLYAMVGALEDRHWIEIAKSERGILLMELEGYRELEEMMRADGIDFEI